MGVRLSRVRAAALAASLALHGGAGVAALAFAHVEMLAPERPVVAVTMVADTARAGAAVEPALPPRTRRAAEAVGVESAPVAELVQDATGASVDPLPEAVVTTEGEVYDAYAAQVWARLARHRPRGAPGAGTARVVFELSRGGLVRSVRLAGSSGVRRFDEAALSAVRAGAPYPPAPALLDEGDLVFEVPFESR